MATELVYLAEHFYKYSFVNIDCLPDAIRPCILVAMRVYREIGMKIVQRPHYAERTCTTKLEKIQLLMTKHRFTVDDFIIHDDAVNVEKMITDLGLI